MIMATIYTVSPAAAYGRDVPDPLANLAADAGALDVLIRPSAPADRRLIVVLVAIFAAASTAPLVMTWRFGAWPVAIFFALDMALIAGAFRLAFRRARYQERLRIGADGAHLVKTAPSGKRAVWSFPTHQIRIHHDPGAHANAQLGLVHQGRCVRFAACLTPEERASLAEAARRAVARHGGLAGAGTERPV